MNVFCKSPQLFLAVAFATLLSHTSAVPASAGLHTSSRQIPVRDYDWSAAEAECASRGAIRNVDIAVEYDSAYCADTRFTPWTQNTAQGTEAAIRATIRNATAPYMRQFCLRLNIVQIIGHCNDPTDPFINAPRDYNRLLDFFQERWATDHRDIDADVAVLFSGVRDVVTASLSYVGAICQRPRNVAFVLNPKPNLFAHELGHLFGCDHLPGDEQGIMNIHSSLPPNEFAFKPASVNVIRAFLNSPASECLARDTITVTPSPKPSPVWTCKEEWFNNNDGCDCGCGVPDPDCNLAGRTYCWNQDNAPDNARCDTSTLKCVAA